MQYRYVAYGLKIDSALELPEFGVPIEREGDADLTIRLAPVARHGTREGGERGSIRWIDSQTFWIHVESVAHFLVSKGREILIMAEADADPGFVRGYLLGSVSGAMLLQRGFLVLHGNAIQVGDGCLICVGDSGAGKSTLAAAFLKRGYKVLADDVVAVDENGCAIPGFPRIKLWQDAADKLGFSTQELRRVFPDMDKFSLPIGSYDQGARLPIRWIYHLTSYDDEDVSIEPITGLHRFRLLRDNTYRNEYLEGRALLSAHLKQCSRLAGPTYLSKVTRPRAGFALDRLIDRLLEDVALTQNAPGGD